MNRPTGYFKSRTGANWKLTIPIDLRPRPEKNQAPMTPKPFAALALSLCLAAHAATTRDVSKLGAKGDGESVDTKVIQAAINDCDPGDTVLIPAGTFVSGA